MRLPGVRKARRIAGRLRQRLERAPIILLYHRITELERDPWEIAVTPQHFAEHLEVLRGGYRPIALRELIVRQRQRQLPRGGVVLTFDDGYADNLSHARPLLESQGCPATFFVTSGSLERGREYWWDELERLLFQPGDPPPAVELGAEGVAYRWQPGSTALTRRARQTRGADPNDGRGDSDRFDLYHSLYRFLRPLNAATQQELLEQLRAFLRVEVATPTHRTMSPDEVAALAGDPLIEVGSHTVTHPMLASQPEAMQRREIEESKRDLEELLGGPVTSFAYPHGGERDFNDDSVALVRQAGYSAACAAYAGVVRNGTDRFRLPRFGVPDCGGEEFARGLDRLFG